MTITDKQITAGGQGGSSSQEHGAGVGIMAEQMMQETVSKAIPAGYKQTEVGVIPEDWLVVQLKQLFVLKNGYAFKGEFFSDKGPVVLTPGNFKLDGGLYFEKRNTKRYSAIYPNSYELEKDDLVVVMTDLTPECNLLGKPAFIEGDEVLLLNQRIGKVERLVNSWDKKFLFYTLLSPSYLSTIKNAATGSTVRHTSPNTIASAWVYEPPKQEQTAIANVLSDSDALIDALEQLIAKKQAIKSAAMQQLLTGRTRLPAFALRPDGTPKGYKPSELGEIPEDWEVCEMGSLGFTYGGLTGKSKKDFGHGNGLYVPFTNVMANIIVDIAKLEKVHVAENQNDVINGDLLFNGSSETPEEVCFCSLVNNDVSGLYLNSFCFGFRRKDGAQYIPIYLSYWFRSSIGRKAVSIMAQGSTRYNISKKQFLKLSITLPSIEEQTAIATILSDMDNELQALTQKLEKARALKQGMMQQLLTGKIRLPLAAEA